MSAIVKLSLCILIRSSSLGARAIRTDDHKLVGCAANNIVPAFGRCTVNLITLALGAPLLGAISWQLGITVNGVVNCIK
ncbi:MAG: hypothetical protein ACRETA_06070, partial [Gammaproteobacteria bacterium]